jgi:hypothetical protein
VEAPFIRVMVSFDEHLILFMFCDVVQALCKSVVGVTPFCNVLVDWCYEVGLLLVLVGSVYFVKCV